jgi:tRNA uridine 5-carbamoylmethylation protein Kti12
MADNTNSKPILVPPSLPQDFEKMAGSSKTDFANALLYILRQSTIDGIQPSQPSDYDISALTKQVEVQQADLDKIKARTPRRKTIAAVNASTVIVEFDDVGTDVYEVTGTWLGENVNFATVNWSVVTGSKQSNQVTIRFDGNASPYALEVTITPMHNI